MSTKKVKVYLASILDKKPTVNCSDLPVKYRGKGYIYIVGAKPHHKLCIPYRLTRKGRTAYFPEWPEALPLPTFGFPIYIKMSA